ncbi:predicted protein [Nematostella vectensis]|uniref:POP1-like protein n=1 Tax=Nematostella vectensis TaxID=45351 RepID=A7SAE7_NEMVE|nr:predicted protein [Nematostella vectensis]|eukprot:XP_001631359.1 predicted protein [Nematostella vectensis]
MKEADGRTRKRIFQAPPKHMRRRAASHDVKRMPVRLREQAAKEVKDCLHGLLQITTTQKKSRRQRRKTSNLMEEYSRRQRQHMWLETHIWHAKRMKMVEKWGYRLAENPTDKSFKAAHRAVTHNCLLQDISYYCCTEVTGKHEDIVSAMKRITSPDTGPSMASEQFLDKSKEGHTIMYQTEQYPYHAIGPVSFMWRPTTAPYHTSSAQRESCISQEDGHNNCQESDKSVLWIWVHPACYHEASDAIVCACQKVARTTVEQDNNSNSDPSNGSNNEDTAQDANRDESLESADGLTVRSLRFDFVRFRLTGPLSHALLVETLTVDNKPSKKDSNSDRVKVDSDFEFVAKPSCGLEKCNKTAVSETSQSVRSASSLPAGSMIGLPVVDPRLFLSGIKTSIDKLKNNEERNASLPSMPAAVHRWPTGAAGSSIWYRDARQQCKESKISEQKLNAMRSNLLVPGSKLELEGQQSVVPVLLVQQPGVRGTGYGSGWDLILPSGWAMAFWIALVYRGARVGGLREARSISLECERPHFPRDFPDTSSGKEHDKAIETEGSAKYLKYPPAKRPNYAKLGVPCPFSYPWEQLVREWLARGIPVVKPESASSCDRERLDLNETKEGEAVGINGREQGSPVENCPKSGTPQIAMDSGGKEFYVLRSKRILTELRERTSVRQHRRKRCGEDPTPMPIDLTTTPSAESSLVCVSLRMLNRGFPLPNAIVAIPSDSDYEALRNSKGYGGPLEPLHKGRKNNSELSAGGTLIGSCSREIIGFVTSGSVSLAHGRGAAIAFCALIGLVKLMARKTPMGEVVVLVRNKASLQYRLAHISVL